MRTQLARILIAIVLRLPADARAKIMLAGIVALILWRCYALWRDWRQPLPEVVEPNDITYYGDPAERSSGFPYDKVEKHERKRNNKTDR